MKVLKKSRKRIKLGDIFRFQILENKFYWGRVVSLNASVGGFEDCILLYIYNVETNKSDEIPETLTVNNLLLGPIATNRLGWSRGYFETIDNRELKQDDLLPVHCFFDILYKKYFDVSGNTIDKPIEPYGDYGLDSYTSIDDKVSEALGIEFAPE